MKKNKKKFYLLIQWIENSGTPDIYELFNDFDSLLKRKEYLVKKNSNLQFSHQSLTLFN